MMRCGTDVRHNEWVRRWRKGWHRTDQTEEDGKKRERGGQKALFAVEGAASGRILLLENESGDRWARRRGEEVERLVQGKFVARGKRRTPPGQLLFGHKTREGDVSLKARVRQAWRILNGVSGTGVCLGKQRGKKALVKK